MLQISIRTESYDSALDVSIYQNVSYDDSCHYSHVASVDRGGIWQDLVLVGVLMV